MNLEGLNLDALDLGPIQLLQLGLLVSQFLDDASDIVGVDLNDLLQGIGQEPQGENEGENDGENEGENDGNGIDLGGIDLGGLLNGLNSDEGDPSEGSNEINLDDLNLDDDATQDLLDGLNNLFGGFPDLLGRQ